MTEFLQARNQLACHSEPKAKNLSALFSAPYTRAERCFAALNMTWRIDAAKIAAIRTAAIVLAVIVLAAIAVPARPALAKDVLEFIDLPAGDDVQAMMDPLLACRDGVMFELHTEDRVAHTAEGPHAWDISFAKEDGNLLIAEHPLWMARSTVSLAHEGRSYPYSGLYTLLWNEALPPTPLTTCIAGAGTGFCEFALPIDDCHLNPWLVAEIAQIGPQDRTSRFVESLVFEVQAYDPEVGTNNGDGIALVQMSITERATGHEVFAAERIALAADESGINYCAFSETCDPWVFAQQNYRWPNGEPVRNGFYLLRAIVSTPDNTRIATQTEIEVNVPPTFDVVHVPAGGFTMGFDTGNASEMPSHVVEVDEFWMMKTEVTNQQYAECVRAGACTRPADSTLWLDAAHAHHPVTQVDWNQANDFAAWAGGRLPTEAEWEKACRGTDGRVFPWGDELPTNDIANFGNAITDTVAVGSYPDGASPYGVLDMSGNVWEWTSSAIAPYPYAADDGREDNRVGDRRVARGGSFYYTHYQLTCTFRSPIGASVANPQNGFRLVFDQPFLNEGVIFTSPATGSVVPTTFEVSMAATGLTIEPAGEIHEGAGHFHILVDSDFVAPGELIPFDETHLHFGQGQLTTTLELEPGEHTLRLQFANGAHIAQDGEQYRDEITVTVQAP
jgi:formylglycine-generating enzyme required for sulfatase activity